MYSSQEWWSSGITSSGGGGGDPGDPIAASLRFRGEADNKLQKTFDGTVSDNYIISFWCRSACSYDATHTRPHWLYIANGAGATELIDDDWISGNVTNGTNNMGCRAWYHGNGWQVRFDDVDVTTNRDAGSWEHWLIKQRADVDGYSELYINGVLYKAVNAYTSCQNATFNIGGMINDDARYYLRGNIAQFYFVEGDAGLDAQVTDFGRFNENGFWVPKDYEGAYGNNGFWLQFNDPNNVGADSSGNGNDLTVVGDIQTADALSPEYDLQYDSPTNTFAQVNGAFSGRAHFACRGGKAVRGAFNVSTGIGMPLTGPKIASDATIYFECNLTTAVAAASWNSWTSGFYFIQDIKQQPIAGIDTTLLYNGTEELAAFDVYADVYQNNANVREDNQITTGSGFTGNSIVGVLIDQGNLTITCNGAATNVTNMPLGVNPDLDGNYNLMFYCYAGDGGMANWLKINTGQKDFQYPPSGVDYKRLCSEDLYELEAIPVSQEHFQAYQAGPDRVIDPGPQLGGNWSFYTTTNTSFSGSQPREFGFNGNLGNSSDAIGAGGIYTKVIWAPDPPIDITGKTVRVRATNDDSDIMIGSETDPDTVMVDSINNTYQTVPLGIRTEIGPNSPLILRRKQPSGSTGWSAIEIDGQVLVDAGVPVIAQQKMPYGLYWSKDMSLSVDWQMWDYQGGANNTQPFGTGSVPGQVMRAYADDANPSAVYAWNAGETGINTDAGFSITTGAHGLLKKPELVISSNGYIWIQKFDDVDGNPTTFFSHLNDAYGYNAGRVLNGEWNVTSSNISCSDPQVDNKFYAWHAVEGFSKFGYWDTNPSGSNGDGVYIQCGFQPAMVWIWYTGVSSGDFHYIYSNNIKEANSNTPECFMFGNGNGPVVSTYTLIDFTKDGFKMRSGNTYPNTNNMSWAAWAEMPTSSALPTRFYNI